MNLTEAAAYADVFAAVEDGTATAAQLVEANAVQLALSIYVQQMGGKIDKATKARNAYFDTLPEQKRAAVVTAVDGARPKEPRIVFDKETGTAMSPKAIADRTAEREAEAARIEAERVESLDTEEAVDVTK